MLDKKNIVMFYTKARLEEDAFKNYMGFFWWVLDPLLTAFVYYIVFHIILHSGKENYMPFLFIGIVTWKWFSICVKNGSSSIASQKSLFKKVYLPKIIFPWIEMNFNTVKFIFAMLLILIIYPLLGYKITAYHFFVPVVIFCQFIFTLGIMTILAALTPFFPDFNLFISHILRLAFYPSGIIFAADKVPENLRFIVEYNPIAQAVESYRNIIMYGQPPSFKGMSFLLFFGFVFYYIGEKLIKKFEGTYAKLL